MPRSSSDAAATLPPDASGISADDRRQLLAWVAASRQDGIDAAEDLRLRPWPMPLRTDIIGVFRTGEDFASWLVVGQNGAWSVVRVADGAVMGTKASLAEALRVIHIPHDVTSSEERLSHAG